MLELEFRVLAGFFFKLKPRLDRVFQASSPKKAWKKGSGRVGLSGRAKPVPPLEYTNNTLEKCKLTPFAIFLPTVLYPHSVLQSGMHSWSGTERSCTSLSTTLSSFGVVHDLWRASFCNSIAIFRIPKLNYLASFLGWLMTCWRLFVMLEKPKWLNHFAWFLESWFCTVVLD